MLTAKIISVGDELFKGTVNTTATTMARELSRLGIEITRIVTAPDKLADISSEIKRSKKTDILIITGGLGPTDDDATVAAVAHAFGVQVTVDPTHLVYLKSIQTRRNLPVQFLKQAEIPKGFSAKKSDFGSAPFIYRLKSKKTNLPIFSIPLVVLLPGVPYECLGLFEQEVLPLIKKLPEKYRKEKPSSANPVVMLELKIIGVAELLVENTLKNILANLFDKKNKTYDGRYLNQKAALHVAFLPNLGELLLRFTTSNGSDGKGVTFLRLITKCLQEAFPARLAYTGNINGSALTVVEKLHQIFIKHKLQVGFIESCTGGLLTASMVELAGSSAYLDAGVVSYANQAKTHFADVSKHTLSKYGAVSEETALEMVRGIMQKRKLNLAVSITGIAGPGGGTKTKPVGLVYIAIRYKPNSQNPKNPKNQTPEEVVRLNLAGQVYKSKGKRLTLYNARTQIRERAVKQAHFMMLKILSKFYPNI